MPFSYTIDSGQGLARVVWTGEVSFEGAQECIMTVSRDPRWRPGFRRLVDMRNASLSVAKLGNRDLANLNATTGPGGAGDRLPRHRVALVTGDELSFGTASQYAAYSELLGVPTEVFRDLGAAERWLGVGAAVRV